MWHIYLAIYAGLAVLLSGCTPESREQTATAPVTRQTMEIAVEELGVVSSMRIVNVKAPHRGQITMIQDDGVFVKAGDVVAVLDTENLEEDLEERIEDLKGVKKELETTIEDLKIAIRNSTLDISSAEVQLDLARVKLADVNKELSELEFLFNNNLVAEDQVRGAQSSVRSNQIETLSQDMSFRGQITNAESSTGSKKLRLERLELDGREKLQRIDEIQERIEQAKIRAAVDGMFLREKRWNWRRRKNMEWQVGEDVREGTQLGSIPDLSSLVISSQIPERHFLDVAVGTEVKLVFEALDNLTAMGKVATIAPVAIERETSPGGKLLASGEQLSGEKVFEITIEFESKDERIKPGITAKAEIVLDRREDLITVPLAAVKTENGRHFVEVKNVNNRKFERRSVKLGDSNKQMVEVLDGLNPGDLVKI